MQFTIYPAIDLLNGRVVRLAQGDYTRRSDYGVDPQRLARQYHQAGASWLHVVDLDGARDGNQANLEMLSALIQTGLNVQAGGGIRSQQDVERLFDTGVTRAVIGSVAVRDPQRVAGWIARYGTQRITVALDARWRDGDWYVASDGWRTTAGVLLADLVDHYTDSGACHVLCTDIDRDGMLIGPNLSLYQRLRRQYPALAVQASGGVRHSADAQALHAGGASGVVLGRSLLENRLQLSDVLNLRGVTS